MAGRIRELRDRRGISAQQLADKCVEAGADWLDRSIIANIESGRRKTISIDEVLVFAYVLDVAPVHLIVPVHETLFMVTPKWMIASSRAREWVRGRYPMGGQDKRTYATEVPDEEWDAVEAAKNRPRNATAEETIQWAKDLGMNIIYAPTKEED